jgi:aminoglycoside phosphotransferase (APT) family kinase protein
LIHGDYWPGNIARPVDGRQVVFDWQLAGIGPGILDLVGFVQTTRLLLDPALSTDDMITLYRKQQAAFDPPGWDDAQFERLWDHALMWVFTTTWLGKLATMPPDDYARLHARFYEVWVKPVLTAVERRLFIDAMSTSTLGDTPL